jgi:hypothetical protein
MKKLLASLFAAVFALATAYSIASPITGTTRLSDDEKKTEETEKKQDYKQVQNANDDEKKEEGEKKQDNKEEQKEDSEKKSD